MGLKVRMEIEKSICIMEQYGSFIIAGWVNCIGHNCRGHNCIEDVLRIYNGLRCDVYIQGVKRKRITKMENDKWYHIVIMGKI